MDSIGKDNVYLYSCGKFLPTVCICHVQDHGIYSAQLCTRVFLFTHVFFICLHTYFAAWSLFVKHVAIKFYAVESVLSVHTKQIFRKAISYPKSHNSICVMWTIRKWILGKYLVLLDKLSKLTAKDSFLASLVDIKNNFEGRGKKVICFT